MIFRPREHEKRNSSEIHGRFGDEAFTNLNTWESCPEKGVLIRRNAQPTWNETTGT